MSAIDNARAALARHDEFMGVEAGEGFNPVENPAWTYLRDLIAEHERLTAPPSDAAIEQTAKAAWIAHNGDDDWARSVVEDVFSPADDWPEEALDMERVARAVLKSAEHTDGSAE